MSRVGRSPEDEERNARAAELMMDGKCIYQAMKQAGFSENVARKGRKALNSGIMAKFKQKGFALMSVSDAMSAEDQERFVRGGLVENVLRGEDKAVQSLKLLGQDARVNMFRPENMTGIIVLQPPANMKDDVPVLEGELDAVE